MICRKTWLSRTGSDNRWKVSGTWLPLPEAQKLFVEVISSHFPGRDALQVLPSLRSSWLVCPLGTELDRGAWGLLHVTLMVDTGQTTATLKCSNHLVIPGTYPPLSWSSDTWAITFQCGVPCSGKNEHYLTLYRGTDYGVSHNLRIGLPTLSFCHIETELQRREDLGYPFVEVWGIFWTFQTVFANASRLGYLKVYIWKVCYPSETDYSLQCYWQTKDQEMKKKLRYILHHQVAHSIIEQYLWHGIINVIEGHAYH